MTVDVLKEVVSAPLLTRMTSAVLFCCLLFPAQAATLNLADSPLFLGNSVDPNVFFVVDDSGSMDWEIMTQKHWHYCAYDRFAGGGDSSSDCGWEVDNGLWRSYGEGSWRYFEYLFNNSDNVYSTGCNNSNGTAAESCSTGSNPVEQDWRVLAPALNTVYYTPDTTYQPPLADCTDTGMNCSHANFLAARSDYYNTKSGYSLKRNLATELPYPQYEIWIDNKGFNSSDGRPKRGSNINVTAGANQQIDLWDSHIRIHLNENDIVITKIDYTPTANALNQTETTMATLTNPNLCYNILGNTTQVTAAYLGSQSYDATDGESCRTIAQTQQNFANWYQYNRRRAMATKMAIMRVMNSFDQFRFGLTVLNNHATLFKLLPNAVTTDYSNHNRDVMTGLNQFNWQPQGTPLRRGLERAGRYYDNTLGKPDPIVHACQQNFSLLLTDGYWNGSTPYLDMGDSDNDGINNTLADVAHYFYVTDLSPLPDDVAPNAHDPATYQHMVTFGIGLGVTGLLTDSDGDGWPNPILDDADFWGNPYNSNPEKVDDLWHAAGNSQGEFISAQTPQLVAESLYIALSNIAERVGSMASVANNSFTLSGDTKIYQAQFDSNGWKGRLLAYPIDAQGIISNTPEWEASCVLSGGSCPNPSKTYAGIAATSRQIITKREDGDGIPFRFPDNYKTPGTSGLANQQVEALMANAPFSYTTTIASQISQNQTYGERLTNFLRGDRSYEFNQSGDFRIRTSILGDIVHSDPVFIGAPNKRYLDQIENQPYSAFKTAYANRTPVIYVGANDGMLHAFNADTGEELMAYIPAATEIYQNLPRLSYHEANSNTPYDHQYFVDGSATVTDAFINNSWMTVLSGGLNAGGQGIYALDVTDPTTFNEAGSNPADIVLWEFTDSDDADLGYTFSKPQIARVKIGTTPKWAVIFGNGYNNTQSDHATSSTGQAALYILLIEAGIDGTWSVDTDYIKIPVGNLYPDTPNGLSSPFLVDKNGDAIVDSVYAGDLKGNLWRFDLGSETPTDWKNSASKIFTAQMDSYGDQPITTPPVVIAHPEGLSQGLLVLFGTGQFLEPGDDSPTGQTTQTFYAIWDKEDNSFVTRSQLLAQKIKSESIQTYDTDGDGNSDTSIAVRDNTNHPINWNTHAGWYLDLIVDGASSNQGERLQNITIIRNGRVVITTLVPSTSPCAFGGDSWIMELDAASGSRLLEAPFDFNEDGQFDNADFINIGDTDNDGMDNFVVASGVKSEVGISATPTVLLSSDKKKEVKIISGLEGLSSLSENPGMTNKGRQNWRRLK